MLAQEFARARIMAGQRAGVLDGPWGSLLKLGEGMDTPALTALSLAIAGSSGVIWSDDEPGGDEGAGVDLRAGHLDRRGLERDAAQHRERAPVGPPA